MKLIKILLTTGLLVSVSLASTDAKPKQTLQANYMVNYKIKPSSVDSLSDVFSEGMLYGRLRSHWFFYDWEDQDATHEDHNILGLGGSLVYKTASYSGFSATAGLYYTSAGTNLDDQPSNEGLLKSGKDVVSRYNAMNGKGQSFAVLAQSYLQYEYKKSKVRFGREIFNSFFTKSNDSKMIPNTFEGVTIETKAIEKTRLRAAYLTRQKLRDHDNFHSVIMYDDRSVNQTGDIKPAWDNNDDSAIHKGLNYTNFMLHGQDENPGLFVVDGFTRAIFDKKLKISASGVYLPDLFGTAMAELEYKFELGAGYTLSPGFRYVQQFDDGAGSIGGAALNGKAARDINGGNALYRNTYTNPDSVDTHMIAGRLNLNKGAGTLSFGYTKIADEADFITPWRGFVTGGYTRAMARYNWVSNTETFRLRGAYNFSKAGIVKGLKTYFSVTHEDYDEKKNPNKDANIYYFGLIHDVQSVANLSFRFRSEYVEQMAAEANNHAEIRLELNYLF